jgi:putative addiction module component (TIGR02574 family)
MTVDELRDQAMKLSVDERAALADLLYVSLEEGTVEEIERAWLAEAQRRQEAFERGEIQAVSAAEAFREARARLRR